MSELFRQHIERVLWNDAAPPPSPMRRALLMPARVIYALGRDLAEGQLTLRAMSLVYTTLLSLVPLLAFSFSLLKGFGVHRQIEPLLFEFLAPLGEKGAEITEQIIGFVDNVRGDVLGSIGLALLIYTVISMVQKIEDTFNYIWQVQKARTLARRFSDYLSVILVGPVLIVTAIGLIATINSSAAMQAIAGVEPFGSMLAQIGRLAPLALVILVFTFVYAFVPNTRVRIPAALIGALLAGTAWTLGGSLFATVIVTSARYAAIYSTFAIAIFALIWLYLSWMIVMLGAQLAFYVQHPRRMRLGRGQLKASIAQLERLALGIMQQVGKGFRSGAHTDFRALAEALDYPARALADITDLLEKRGLLAHTEDGAFVPGRDPATISLAEILAAVRGEDPGLADTAVQEALQAARAAEAERLSGRTMASLAGVTESVAGDRHPPDQQ